MSLQALGSPSLPALVCLPGLLGSPDDFRSMLDEWAARFHVLLLDPNAERQAGGIGGLTAADVREVSYDSTCEQVVAALDRCGKIDAAFVGLSLGGKVVYEFAIRHPARFRGGVVTDVSPGPFEESELFGFVYRIVREAPLNLPWEELKAAFRALIADRSLRSLLLSQIHYPDGPAAPARWKVAMREFGQMLEGQGIADQMGRFQAVDAELQARGSFIDVLKADRCSGISPQAMPRIERLRSLRLHRVEGASHFIHITHQALIRELVLRRANECGKNG